MVYQLRKSFAGTATSRETTQCAAYTRHDGSTTEKTARAEFEWAAPAYLTAAGRSIDPVLQEVAGAPPRPARGMSRQTTTTTGRTQYSDGTIRDEVPSVEKGSTVAGVSLQRGPGSLTVVPHLPLLSDTFANPAERFPYTLARGTVSRRITGTYSTPATGDCSEATTYEWDATVTLTAQ